MTAHLTSPALAARLLVLALSLGACGGEAPERAPEAGGSAPESGGSAPESGGSAPQAAAAGEVAVIRGMAAGDRACYVELEGAEEPQEAAFELCERMELAGKRVRLTRERTTVQAASCEGDPECTRSDTVDLIVSAEVLP